MNSTSRSRRDELFLDPINPDDPVLARDGRLTDEGVTVLRLRMPYANFRDLEFDRRLNRVDDLFTVELLRASSRGSSVARESYDTMFPSRFPTILPEIRHCSLIIHYALVSEQLLKVRRRVAHAGSTGPVDPAEQPARRFWV